MPAPVELLSAFAGFGLIVVAGAWLGAGSHLCFTGLFPAHGRSDWPQGVQEGDVPRFAVDHVDRLRAAPPADAPSIRDLDEVEPAAPVELVDLHVMAPSYRQGA